MAGIPYNLYSFGVLLMADYEYEKEEIYFDA
jgi:hypothetical protein